MDGPTFDALTKTFTAGITRRRLTGLVTGLVAGVVTRTASAAVGRPGGAVCRKHGDCASNVCLPPDATGRRYCQGALGGACAKGTDCASGFCVNGICCNRACGGVCETCAKPGLLGTCSGRTGVTCGAASCNGTTHTATSVCDSAGICQPGAVSDCSPYLCGGNGACLTACTDAIECASEICLDSICCPAEDYCSETESCCSGTATCCSNGQGCCECFSTELHGLPEVTCCPAERVCGVYPDDTCCFPDESCFNGQCVWSPRVCAGAICPNQCCGDECCGPWDVCGANGCEAIPTCAVGDGSVCGGSGRCVTIETGAAICCPADRFFDLETEGEPAGTYLCCPFGMRPGSNSGEPTHCCAGPDYCGDSRGSSFRV
jgi:hypothetical protein